MHGQTQGVVSSSSCYFERQRREPCRQTIHEARLWMVPEEPSGLRVDECLLLRQSLTQIFMIPEQLCNRAQFFKELMEWDDELS